jgi:GNAT superfamily N-acetyltransferase
VIDRIDEIAALMEQRCSSDAAWAARGARHNCVYVCDAEGKVAAVARLEQAQWYACEVRSVAVRVELQGQGWGRRVLAEIESKALRRNAAVMTATIRTRNFASKCLFYGAGYRAVARFISPNSGLPIEMWVKTLAR